MSKTRWDRRPKPAEQWDSDYTALGGGIDQSSSALAVKPGRLRQSLNWEEVYGKQGYTTVRGYERFDGGARPSQAEYITLPFDGGSIALAQGDVISAPGATAGGTVVSVTLSSGGWGTGNAAGILVVTAPTGEWDDNDAIQVGGVTRATVNGEYQNGSYGNQMVDHVTTIRAVRSYVRSLIDPVPGEGAVLGVAVYNGIVYAVRNIVGGASATLWRSSAAGWVSVRTGLHAGGSYRFWSANFTGDPTNLYLFGVNGRGRLFRVDRNNNFTKAGLIYGTEATSATNVAYGTGAKNFTVETGRGFTAGQAITVWDSANAANYMAGTVTSYNSGTGALVLDATSFNGAGSNAAWEVGLTDFSDKPFLLREYKNHLFLAFPRGQLQTSALGDPMTYTGGTVALFGMGQEITGFASLRGKALAVFARSSIKVLSGSSSADFDLGPYSDESGAVLGTVQDNASNPLYIDSKGLSTMQATQAFGDYASSLLSRDVKKLLDGMAPLVTGSRMATNNQQYRLYASDGRVMRATITSAAESIGPKDISFTLCEYLHVPACWDSGVMADGKDRMFFGTSDGYVMEEDVGTSFDGAEIDYVLRLPFHHFKSPQFIKEFKKLELELEVSDPDLTFNYRQVFDYDDGTYQFNGAELITGGIGGQFDVGRWDAFQFDQPVEARAETSLDGQGRNMALLLFFASDYVSPVALQGLLTYFIKLGMQR